MQEAADTTLNRMKLLCLGLSTDRNDGAQSTWSWKHCLVIAWTLHAGTKVPL